MNKRTIITYISGMCSIVVIFAFPTASFADVLSAVPAAVVPAVPAIVAAAIPTAVAPVVAPTVSPIIPPVIMPIFTEPTGLPPIVTAPTPILTPLPITASNPVTPASNVSPADDQDSTEDVTPLMVLPSITQPGTIPTVYAAVPAQQAAVGAAKPKSFVRSMVDALLSPSISGMWNDIGSAFNYPDNSLSAKKTILYDSFGGGMVLIGSGVFFGLNERSKRYLARKFQSMKFNRSSRSR